MNRAVCLALIECQLIKLGSPNPKEEAEQLLYLFTPRQMEPMKLHMNDFTLPQQYPVDPPRLANPTAPIPDRVRRRHKPYG